MEHASTDLDAFGVAWRLGATLFFVALNGFFVATEFALVKVRASRIDQLARQGRRRAAAVQHILAHLDRYLTACQLGITLASLILGALGEPAVSVLIIAGAGGLGLDIDPEAGWLSVVSIGLAFFVITALHMTVGEQAPKMWALRRAEATALQTGQILRVFTFTLGPFISAINSLSNWVLRLAGLPPDEGHESSHTAEEIRSILSLSASTGQISDREYELTANVFRMIELEVRHIIVPRIDVQYLSLEKSPEDNLRRIREMRHSRIPLCEIGLDTVQGFVHAKDVLDRSLAGETPDLVSLARPAIFVPDTMSISDFLLELQQQRAHCAVVLDERGTALGLAFREDALEEIVGPLGDEFHDPEIALVDLGGGRFELSGRVALPEVCDRLGIELPAEEEEAEDTIGGHVTARLGRLPRKGDAVEVGPFEATVIEVGRRRVQRLRMEQPQPAEAAEEDAP
ncbi:MAG: HlyC/CorC family transporter [bacterium]|nr:HlyC/CorC family transporter [bacterium]MCP5070464.1 HlyC/CorC family transporter [bacterium]